VCLVSWTGFGVNEWLVDNPLIPTKVLKDGVILSSLFSRFLLNSSYMGAFMILPFFLHEVCFSLSLSSLSLSLSLSLFCVLNANLFFSQMQQSDAVGVSALLFIRPLAMSAASSMVGLVAKIDIDNIAGVAILVGAIICLTSQAINLFFVPTTSGECASVRICVCVI